ncbi:MAG: hypothetical protein J7604_25210 [Sporocytophaga sp.]|uniref:hypothetical protein n=1 Tax=Sporocytophaga sp. TaxID=2231183 RepID=UPI001B0D1080|nr:hypothetical protein [Sporocytophaga sp.]MBO9703532.1 hypothetical protein [Sporocytophaga sp.]
MRAYFKLSTVLFFLLICMQNAFAIDINPGENRTECPGTKIRLGGSPTAGPDAPDSYKYQWSSNPGGFSSTESNPEITVQDVKTVYVVRVTDADGFTCQESVTITPVKISKVQFNPTYLPADGKSVAQASVVSDPSGRTIVWSIVESEGTNATIGESNGRVKASTEPATVKIRAQDKQAADNKTETCYAEENLCIGDPEECCPDLAGEVKFGLLRIQLTESIKSTGSAEGGYCSYSTNKVRLHLDMKGFFHTPVSFDLDGVRASWKQKGSGAEISFKEVSLEWSGKAPTRQFGPLMANLTGMKLTVTSDGAISGETKFTINQVEAVSLGGMAELAKGTSGEFVYRYTSSTSFEGSYDFGGVRNIVIHLKKNASIIAEASGGHLTTNGDLMNAELTAKSSATFSTKGFDATLKKLRWRFNWKINENDIEFKDGEAEVAIKNIKNTKGEVNVDFSLNGTFAEGTAKFTNLTAFGCKIEGSLGAKVDYEFNIHEINGSNIKAKHPDFENSFEINEFNITNGELTRFSFKGHTKYKKIVFNIKNAEYVQNKGVVITAGLDIGKTSKCDVENFTISSEGAVSVGKLFLESTSYPLYIKANLTFTNDQFTGEYTGSIEGGIKIGGKVVIGSMETYNYGFFELTMQVAKGFPVGPVIRIDELGGRFGYNYDHRINSASQGTYLIGFALGIKDAADIIGLKGDVTLVIGNKSSLELEGEVRVPAKSPHYFKGTLKASYLLGTNDVSGSTNATLKIPARNGNILSLSSGNMSFKLNQSGWNARAMGISGSIMKQVTMNGSFDLRGASGDNEGITGTVSGNIDYAKELQIIYPEKFDGTNCVTADQTDSKLGFGIYGYFNLKMGGSFNTQVHSEGFTGTIKTYVNGVSRVSVKWPCIATCVDCVRSTNVNVNGDMEMSYDGSFTILKGYLKFSGADHEEESRPIVLKF